MPWLLRSLKHLWIEKDLPVGDQKSGHVSQGSFVLNLVAFDDIFEYDDIHIALKGFDSCIGSKKATSGNPPFAKNSNKYF